MRITFIVIAAAIVAAMMLLGVAELAYLFGHPIITVAQHHHTASSVGGLGTGLGGFSAGSGF